MKRHPGHQRRQHLGQLRAGPICTLRSLPLRCSLVHGGSLVPALWTGWSWQTRFSGLPRCRRYSVLKFNSERDTSRVPRGVTLRFRVDRSGRLRLEVDQLRCEEAGSETTEQAWRSTEERCVWTPVAPRLSTKLNDCVFSSSNLVPDLV
jgi:hypothetical protein